MTAITLQLPPLHEGQRAIFADAHRFKAVSAGRRFGKTKLGALMCFAVAAQGGRAWWVAPQYGIALIGWRMMRRLAVQVPNVTVRESERMITLPTGGTVQIKSADNPDSLRGEGLNFCVLDECAFLDERAWVEVLRPALADRQGGALFISTPKGRNWFWRIFQAAHDDSAWRAFHFTSYDNPYIPPGELDALKAQISERAYRQEILAEFVEDGGGVFRRVADAATATPQDKAQEGRTYVFGVDWGRSGDYTVIAVLDITAGELVHLDRFTQVGYDIQLGRLRALYDRFRPVTIIAEANSMGGPLTEALQRMALPVRPFTTTNATKATIIDALALGFERGDLRIINDPVLVAELQAYEMERLPSGLLRYSAPDGMHDDCVMGLALAWHGAATRMSSLVSFA